MSLQRIDRVNEILKREIASGLYRLKTDPPLDLARVTVSHVVCAPDLRRARVLVSVLRGGPATAGAEGVVRLLNRHRKEIQAMLARNVILKYTPQLQFVEDDSAGEASHVLHLLDQLPPPAPEEESDGTPEA